jgi:hypothetical protein
MCSSNWFSTNLALHTCEFWCLIKFIFYVFLQSIHMENLQIHEENENQELHHPLQMIPQEWLFKTKTYNLSSDRCVWKLNIKRLKMIMITFYGHTSLVLKGSVLRLAYWTREKRHVWFTGECTLKEMKHTIFITQVKVAGNISKQKRMYNWYRALSVIRLHTKDLQRRTLTMSTASTMPECKSVNPTSPFAIWPTFIRYPRHFSTYLHAILLRALKTQLLTRKTNSVTKSVTDDVNQNVEICDYVHVQHIAIW